MIKAQTNYQFPTEFGGLEVVNASYQNYNFANHNHEGYAINVIEKERSDFYALVNIIYPSPFKMQVLIRLKNIFTALLNLK